MTSIGNTQAHIDKNILLALILPTEQEIANLTAKISGIENGTQKSEFVVVMVQGSGSRSYWSAKNQNYAGQLSDAPTFDQVKANQVRQSFIDTAANNGIEGVTFVIVRDLDEYKANLAFLSGLLEIYKRKS